MHVRIISHLATVSQMSRTKQKKEISLAVERQVDKQNNEYQASCHNVPTHDQLQQKHDI